MIYARLDTTTAPPQLDWGHAVYPAKGQTLESLGYREFPDLASARAYYGIPETSTPTENDEP